MINDQDHEKLTRALNDWERTPKIPVPRDREAFRQRVLEVFSRHEETQRNARNCAKGLEKALRQTQKAIETLSATHAKGYSNAQTRHVLALLEKAYSEAGEPKEKGEIHKSYYDSASDTWMRSVLTENVIKARSPEVRLIFTLEALWLSEFGERPNKADEQQFFIFAGGLLGIDPNSVERARNRTVKPE